MAAVQIFLSAVSAEFKSYRTYLLSQLTLPGVAVKTQEDFVDFGGVTLEKLSRYIQGCDAVVHLIGDGVGAQANEPSVNWLRRHLADFPKRVPVLADEWNAEMGAASYTQWEAWLALYHDKPLFIAQACPSAPREPGFAAGDEEATAQANHVAKLRAAGRYPGVAFTDAKDLAVGLLRNLSEVLRPLRRPQSPRRWPTGCRDFLLEAERTQVGFNAYLRGSHKLAYVPVNPNLTPARLFEGLSDRTGWYSTVLHGRGGAGKSRLMWEVGYVAVSEGWTVLLVAGDQMPPDRLMEALDLAGGAAVLLLMDYVERCENWDSWLWAIQDAHDVGRKVHLLGTCRTRWSQTLDSYQTQLEAFPEIMPETVIGILKQRDGLIDLAASCRGIPVFAAFLCMLHDAGQDHELSALRRERDFDRWLQQHLVRLPRSGTSSDHAALVELLINLPCSETVLQAMEAATPTMLTYRGQLVDDGWLIEDIAAPESERWSALHDILADGALLRWLSSTPLQQAQAQMQRWISAARQRGDAKIILRSLQRVGQEEALRKLNWPLIFGGSPLDSISWQQERDAILSAHLMSPLVAFEWLDGLPESAEEALSSFAVHMTLGDAIKAWRAAPELDSALASRLLHWANLAAETLTGHGVPTPPGMPNRVLVQAFTWRPHQFREYARQWLKVFHRQEQAQFLLNAWLGLGPPEHKPQDVQVWCDAWLQRYGCRAVASFVFSRWLNAGGAKLLVKDFIRQWLVEPGNVASPGTKFVFCAWLDAGGEKALVEESVRRWLAESENVISLAASFVFVAWLDAGGEKALVEGPVRQWMAEPGNTVSRAMQFVFVAWLDAGGEKALVKGPIRQWLAEPGNTVSRAAQFVFKAWLDAGGEKALVKGPIRQWLAEPGHSRSPAAQYVFKAWLDAGGKKALVEGSIRHWLAEPEHSISPAAKFVFKAWLDAGGNKALVEEPIREWLSEAGHAVSLGAEFVYTAWLNSGGDVAFIESAIRSWLSVSENAISEGAGYLIKSIGNRDSRLPEWLADTASRWIQRWCSNVDAVYVLKHISGMNGISNDAIKCIIEWCINFQDHPYAMGRMASIGWRRLGVFNDRERLVITSSQMILNSTLTESSHESSLLSGLKVVSDIWRLPMRNVGEKAAFVALAASTCHLIRSAAGSDIPDLDNFPNGWKSFVVTTDWERLIQIGLSNGQIWDGPLQIGVNKLSKKFRPWAESVVSLNMYDRLISKSNSGGTVLFPRTL